MSSPQRPAIDRLVISIARQMLFAYGADGETVAQWPVSTASVGAGEENGSGATPRGEHYIRAKIGAGQPENTVFRGRRPTGERYSPSLAQASPGRDWILSRILWLCGREPGHNRGGDVDTFRRYIYIHGTPDAEPMGVPRSHGCIRMRNRDVIELFDQVAPGTPVTILET